MSLDAHMCKTANKSQSLFISVEYTAGVGQGKAQESCGQTWVGILAPKHKAV